MNRGPRIVGNVRLSAGLERNVGVHAQNPVLADYTMCGLAFDAYDSGDVDNEVIFAAAGETITCRDCRRAVIEVRKIKLGRLRTTPRFTRRRSEA